MVQDINPKISIIIPVYNVEKYIEECLDSCINQTLKEIEVIVIDDRGQDKSIDIALEYAKKDDRIRIFHNEKNLGLFLAREEGVKRASASYITFLDSDDFLDLKACEIAYDVAVQGNFDCVYFGSYRYEKNLKNNFLTLESKVFQSLGEYSKWFYKQKYPHWNIWASLIKKDKILEATKRISMDKDSGLTVAEDVLYSFTIRNLCEKFINIPDILHFYRYNPLSSTNDTSDLTSTKKLKDHDLVINKILELSRNYKTDPRLLKLYLSLLLHERKYIQYIKSKNNNTLNLRDKIKFWIHRRNFIIRRKLRLKFGI